MKIIRICTASFARFCISLIFLAGAINKIMHWQEMEGNFLNTLCEWQFNLGFSDSLQTCVSQVVPFAPIILIVVTLFEFLGTLSVLLGIKEKLGATLLILFLIPGTIVMHQFWFVEGVAREIQLTHFLKNLAILGGLLLILLQEKKEKAFSDVDPY